MVVKKIGELLVDAGLISQEQLDSTLAEGKGKKKKRLGELLVEKGFATELDIAQTLAYQLNIPYIDLHTAVIDPEAIKLVSEKLARQYKIIPIAFEKRNVIRIAMSDPLDITALDDIRFATNHQVLPMVAVSSDIIHAIKIHYHISLPIEDIVGNMAKEKMVEVVHRQDNEKNIDELLKKSEAPPIIKMVDTIIIHGIENRASDIHIEPHARIVQLRERVDGIMRDVMQLPKWVQGAVTSRIKIMAKMDIAERRVPQDGRIQVRIEGRELDMRISTLPTQYGEKVVMRILDTKSTMLSIDDIGLSALIKERIRSIIERPQGIVLVTGPTGSGKTSSLYAMIGHIKTPEINIITLEDPIEYELEGVNQVAINEKVGLTFAYCLRSVLRQDPDVIFVGEMRDTETSEIAHQASLTGHLVFSTLHTTNAVSTITRLKNMGIPPYLIASSLNGIVAQRLVRKVCQACKEQDTTAAKESFLVGSMAKKHGELPMLLRGKGCNTCGGTGYYGRTGVFEVLVVDSNIRELIASGASEDTIRNAAISVGMVPLFRDGVDKIMNGVTTLDELQSVVTNDDTVIDTLCANCSAIIGPEFAICPYCGYSVNVICQHCKRKREPGWSHCPYCSAEFEKTIPNKSTGR